jgi:hypothetical protein
MRNVTIFTLQHIILRMIKSRRAEWAGHVTCKMHTKLQLEPTQREHLEILAQMDLQDNWCGMHLKGWAGCWGGPLWAGSEPQNVGNFLSDCQLLKIQTRDTVLTIHKIRSASIGLYFLQNLRKLTHNSKIPIIAGTFPIENSCRSVKLSIKSSGVKLG